MDIKYCGQEDKNVYIAGDFFSKEEDFKVVDIKQTASDVVEQHNIT